MRKPALPTCPSTGPAAAVSLASPLAPPHSRRPRADPLQREHLMQRSELVTSFPVPTVLGYPNAMRAFAFSGLTQVGHATWGNPSAPHSHTSILSLSFSPSFSLAGYPLGPSRARSGAVSPRTPSLAATFLSHLLSLRLFAALRLSDCTCHPHRILGSLQSETVSFPV